MIPDGEGNNRPAGGAEQPLSRRALHAVALISCAGMFLLAVLLGWISGVPALGQLRFTWSAVLWGSLGTLPPLAALWWCLNTRFPPCVRLVRAVREKLFPIIGRRKPADYAIISLAAGVGEEALFRGFLQTALAGWLGPVPGVAIAGITFGLCHPLTFAYIVAASLAGAYLGILLIVTGNLLAPMLAHGIYNFAAFLVVSGER